MNKTEKYNLFLENIKTPIGTAGVEKNCLYLNVHQDYQQALKTLINGILAKGAFVNIQLHIKDRYIEIAPLNEMLLRAIKQESSLFLKIHFVEELVS